MQEQVEVCCIVREIYNGVFEAHFMLILISLGLAAVNHSRRCMRTSSFYVYLNSTLLRFENSQLVSSHQFIIILRFLENL